MGVGLDLRGAKRVAIGTREVVAFGTAGGAWYKPPPAVADYYGTSAAGDVVTDLRLDLASKMTLSGDLITSVANDGGAGAMFALSAPAGYEPRLPASGAVCADYSASPAKKRRLVAANAMDMQGVHLMVPIKFDGAVPRYIGGGGASASDNQIVLFGAANNQFTIRLGMNSAPPFVTSAAFSLGLNAWQLVEIRLAGGRFKIWVNKTLVSDVAITNAAYLLKFIGDVGGDNYPWIGQIGRALGIKAMDATTVYPSFAAVWRELNLTYGTPA